MTTRPDGPTGPTDDRADDVGTDPMHPHPQDRPPGDQSARREADPPESGDDGPGEPTADEDDRGGAGRTDDESPVERYRDSPGAAAARPMSDAGDVPEPNEPA